MEHSYFCGGVNHEEDAVKEKRRRRKRNCKMSCSSGIAIARKSMTQMACNIYIYTTSNEHLLFSWNDCFFRQPCFLCLSFLLFKVDESENKYNNNFQLFVVVFLVQANKEN